MDSTQSHNNNGREMSMETEDDTLVTIDIYENELPKIISCREESDFSPQMQITKMIFSPDYSLMLKQLLESCLKLSFGTEYNLMTEDNHATNTREISCFVCFDKLSTYNDLKRHLLKNHSLSKDVGHLTDSSPEFIEVIAKEVKHLKCVCPDFKCDKCNVTFKLLSPLILHVFFEHSLSFSEIPHIQGQNQCQVMHCYRCTILNKLHKINYHLFISILLNVDNCFDDIYAPLLQWNPLNKPPNDFDDSITEEKKGDLSRSNMITDGSESSVEAVCYSILQQPKKISAENYSNCICPILKCPACPKTTSNFKDLRKHVRLNDHNAGNGLKLMWNKYKIIKDNCPECQSYPYLSYILCPHCPQLAFEDEGIAQAHMDSKHCRKGGELDSKLSAPCICAKHFTCFTCKTEHRTPQGLHHHLRRLAHETSENFDAIPYMMRKRTEDKKNCPQCSLYKSSTKSISGKIDEQQCTCVWAVCETCGSSYRKISALMDHLNKSKHPINVDYIEEQQRSVAYSFKSCPRCNNMEDRYCIFCNTKVNFIYYHIKTQHQDQQILLLSNQDGSLMNEFDVTYRSKDAPKYECSICLQRFLHTTTLRRHVCKVHPDCYFTLQCIDLGYDMLTMSNFAKRKEIKVLTVTTGK